jgi:UTP--glucose-1-phosphate uridylyltransferase
MSQKIRKAVIPAAGFGTRFLPATKAMPKEMLPIVDKPIIQYVVEEAVASGIQDIIIVTGWHKRSIEDHFDYPFELEKRLLEAGKERQAEEVRRIANMANFIYVRQKGPYGNGTPVMNARQVIGNEPFAVLWGDEFIHADPPRLKQMIDVYEKNRRTKYFGRTCPCRICEQIRYRRRYSYRRQCLYDKRHRRETQGWRSAF